MRVLVTGSTGFLGCHVVEELIARGHRVVGAARTDGRTAGTGTSAGTGTGTGRATGATEPYAVDLVPPGAAGRLLDAVQPEAVVSLAALPDIAPCRADPATAARLNAEVPAEIAAWCARRARSGAAAAAAPRLLHVSTDQVFDGSRGSWREEDEALPLHEYGRTKLAGERAVLAACPQAAVLRPALLTGLAPPGRRSASSALLESLASGATPRMFTDELRSPVAAVDVARALADLLERPDAAGLFHCGGPEVLSRHALARREAELAGLAPGRVAPATRADLGLAAERPADLSLDSSRLAALLGWRPRTLARPA